MGPSRPTWSASKRVVVAWTALLMVATGCGYSRPKLMPVVAVVSLAGEPIGGAEVMLVPTGPGRPIRGVSDESGRVTFSTYGHADGVPKGSYKVVVSKLELTRKAARKLDAGRAKRPAAQDDGPVEVMLELSDDDYRNALPSRYASVETTTLTAVIEAGTRQLELTLEPDVPAK